MDRERVFETIVGVVVLMIAASFFKYAYNYSHWQTTTGYELIAKFDKVDGLTIGSDIRMSGLKVGTIIKAELDPKTYLAVLTLRINESVKLPTDTTASVASEGLLGGRHLALLPGGEESFLKDKDEINHTQGAINLESLIGKMVFSPNQQKSKTN